MSQIKSKIKNFWYYYKVHSIIAAILVVMIAIGVTQCASVEKYDYSVVLYMSKNISEAVANVMADQFASCGTDQNGDGKVLVEVINCSYGDNENLRMNQIGKLQARLTMPESVLFIVDETCYTSLNDQGLFDFCNLPDKDGTALNLSRTAMNTDIERDFGACMPTNYYLCKRKISGTAFEGNAEAQGYEATSTALLNALCRQYGIGS